MAKSQNRNVSRPAEAADPAVSVNPEPAAAASDAEQSTATGTGGTIATESASTEATSTNTLAGSTSADVVTDLVTDAEADAAPVKTAAEQEYERLATETTAFQQAMPKIKAKLEADHKQSLREVDDHFQGLKKLKLEASKVLQAERDAQAGVQA